MNKCALCEREQKLTFHHLIPQSCHKNKWFKKNFTTEEMKTRGLNLCTSCHKHIHKNISEKDLGRNYNTKEQLLAHKEIFKFVQWIRKQKG